MSARAVTNTLIFLCCFYSLLGGMELLLPQRACQDGLAGPLTATGTSPELMCAPVLASPAGKLVLFGLGKYHAIFAAIAAHAVFTVHPAHSRLVLALNALNFSCDVAWAAWHINWISVGPIALLPQAALVAWLTWLITTG